MYQVLQPKKTCDYLPFHHPLRRTYHPDPNP